MSGRIVGRSRGVEDFYRAYIARCNAHEFASLGEFVADEVIVNDVPVGLDGYIAGLASVVQAFPDFHWELRHLLVDAPWISAHFADTGSHAGRVLRVQELALYRIADGRIAEVWGDLADPAELIRSAR